VVIHFVMSVWFRCKKSLSERPSVPKTSTRSMEYLALIAEIESLKEELALLKVPKQPRKPVKVPCPGVTGKGHACKKYCVAGETTCKVHGREEVVKPKKVPKAPKKMCVGMNMRGNACKGKCLPNETFCEKHDPTAPVKEKKVKKKKVAPEHNHGVGVEPLVPCELCETHGDMFDAGVTEVKWVDEGTFWASRNEPRMI
jgi:hypothetical protein